MVIEALAVLIKSQFIQENSYLINCFTRDFGLIKGFLKSRNQIQNESVGNIIKITRKARLSSHLGFMTIEPNSNVVGLIAFDQLKLLVLNSAVSLLRLILNENEPQPLLFDKLLTIIKDLKNNEDAIYILKQYVFFEFTLLKMCGFGLDLNKCVVSSTTENLSYISPKSGRAVSFDVGKPYHDKLFQLPKFLLDSALDVGEGEILASLKITQHFINKNYLSSHNLKTPFARIQLMQYILSNNKLN